MIRRQRYAHLLRYAPGLGHTALLTCILGLAGCKLPGFSKSDEKEPELPSYASFVGQESEAVVDTAEEQAITPAFAKSSASTPVASTTKTAPPGLMAAALGALNATGPDNSPTDPAKGAAGKKSPTLNVHGVLPNGGPVRVAVFSDAAQFPNQQQAVTTTAIPSQGGSVQTALEISPDAPYAVAVYQDLNDDGTLNRSSFGMPMEPYGFSRDAVGKLGPPSFEQAQVPPGTTSVDVNLQSPISNLPF